MAVHDNRFPPRISVWRSGSQPRLSAPVRVQFQLGSWYVCHVSLSELIRGDSIIIIMVSTTYGRIELTNMCQARYPVGLYCFSVSHSCPCL